jgi:hypothetical protein
MIKLPEPEGRICFDGGDWEEDFVSSQDAYSEEQMLQFRRDVLEEAANIADDEPEELSGDGTYVCTPSCIARAIRKLGESL